MHHRPGSTDRDATSVARQDEIALEKYDVVCLVEFQRCAVPDVKLINTELYSEQLK